MLEEKKIGIVTGTQREVYNTGGLVYSSKSASIPYTKYTQAF